jgi:hypothetical protein
MKFKQVLNEMPYNYANFRGNVTLDKIKRNISPSLTTQSKINKIYARGWEEINKFSSAKEFEEHMYWHGSGGGVSGGLIPGYKVAAQNRGSGHDFTLHTVSLSKSKKRASIFSGQSNGVMIYPVLLRATSKVKEMPEIQDSVELEQDENEFKLAELWKEQFDAVKIGDWSDYASEMELVVINPRCLLLFRGEYVHVAGTGRQGGPKFDIPDSKVYEAIFNAVKSNPKPVGKDSFIEVKV